MEKFTVPSKDGGTKEIASFRGALIKYGAFLEDIGVQPPFKWIAGMENLKGKVLYMPTQAGHMRVWPGPDGKCLVDVVSEFGLYTPGDKPGPTLKPFFTKLYNACATSRQDWQDAYASEQAPCPILPHFVGDACSREPHQLGEGRIWSA